MILMIRIRGEVSGVGLETGWVSSPTFLYKKNLKRLF
jgi:hypothetical protein